MTPKKTTWTLAQILAAALLSGCVEGVLESSDVDDVTQKRRASSHRQGVEPLRALYITSYGNVRHDDERQQKSLFGGISRYVNIEFSMVGKGRDDALRMMSQHHFSAGYDVVIYNMCFPDDQDTQRIDNIISQIRDLGVPAVLLHCAMHSFQITSPNLPEHQLELAVAEAEWADDTPGAPFPHWWTFTGVDTLTHDWARAMKAERFNATHPILARLPAEIRTRSIATWRWPTTWRWKTPTWPRRSSPTWRKTWPTSRRSCPPTPWPFCAA